jgi:hypothetical protein
VAWTAAAGRCTETTARWDSGTSPALIATANEGDARDWDFYAFDLSSSPGEAEFAGWINTRNADTARRGIEFVPASKSPTGKAMLLVTYEITGTVAAYGISG